MLTDLGKVIRHWRFMRKKTIRAMARALDMELHYLSGIENGRFPATQEDLLKIASYMAGKNWKFELKRQKENENWWANLQRQLTERNKE